MGRGAEEGCRGSLAHLLVYVDGLLVLLQLGCVPRHLQQTLVGRAKWDAERVVGEGAGGLGTRVGRRGCGYLLDSSPL